MQTPAETPSSSPAPSSREPKVWLDRRPLQVLGAGSALPGPPISTVDLLDRIEDRFGIVVRDRGEAFAHRLGIRHRHIVRDFAEAVEGPRPGASNVDLAAGAIAAALADAGLDIDDVDYLIGHTATPSTLIPSNIAWVADRLGYAGPHQEFRQACTGFANAVVAAAGLIDGGARAVAIVGSETCSVYFDPRLAATDLSQLINLVQMGDGAGAIVLGPATGQPGRLTGAYLGQVGGGRAPGLALRAGGSDQPWLDNAALTAEHDFQAVRATGPELFLRGAEAVSRLGLDPLSADMIVPHQANGRLAEQFEAVMGIPRQRVFVHADAVGNTGSAAMWLAFATLRPSLAAGARVAALGAEATKHLFGGFVYEH